MVKKGYKQTEIGVIPEDWECVLLLDKSKLLNGLTYTPDNVKNNGLLVLRSSNIQNNQLSLEDTLYVNCIVEDEKKIKDGDIMICVRNGSAALIGKCAQAHRDYDATFGAFMAVLRGNHNDYILQILQQGTIQKEIIKNSGATINQITNGDFKIVKIALPTSNDEEIAIASSLSNVDKLISSLEKLITKKKAIKQGTMQELLTGKRRLPGFFGEWVNTKIGSITEVYSGGTPNTSEPAFWGGKIPWMNSGELNLKIVRQVQGRITEVGMDSSSTHFIPAECVLIGLAGQGKTRGTAAFNTFPLCTNQSIAAIYPNPNKFDSKFLYYKMDTQYDQLRELSSGDGGRGGLNKKLILDYEVVIPQSIDEQAAIATILTEMDYEIENLEMKLTKYRQVKQGMMQQLLTGKIRLV